MSSLNSEPPPAGPAAGAVADLLRPSVDDSPPQGAGAARPWRLGSQFYVAFFGGAAGAAIIATINARRLGLPADRQWAIAGLGVLGVIATALVLSSVGTSTDDGDSAARILGKVVGVVAWGGMYLIQRTADRVYEYRAGAEEPYASLWVPGLLAAIAGAIVQFVVLGSPT